MELANFFKEAFEYNHHFNKEIIKLIIENSPKVSEKTINLINHILNAQQIWNERIINETNKIGVWDIRELNELLSINERNYSESLNILSSLELNKTLSYKTSKEVEFNNSIKDILFHVINHSTYHRGQIASELKTSGIEPISTDYIFYKRTF